MDPGPDPRARTRARQFWGPGPGPCAYDFNPGGLRPGRRARGLCPEGRSTAGIYAAFPFPVPVPSLVSLTRPLQTSPNAATKSEKK